MLIYRDSCGDLVQIMIGKHVYSLINVILGLIRHVYTDSVKKWYMYTCACICISQYVTLFLVNFLFFVAVNFDLYFIYMYYF